MGKIARTAAYAVGGGLLFTGLGYSADHLTSEGIGRGSRDNLPGYDITSGADAQQAFVELTAAQRQAEQSLKAVEDKVGETCVRFLDYYMPIDLFDNRQTLAVSDGIREPGSPCGDSQHGIRIAYDSLLGARDDLAGANYAAETAQDAVAYYEEAVRDDNDFSGAKSGAAVGVVLGGLVGFFRRERFSN